MRKALFTSLLSATAVWGIEPLPDAYQVSFGSANAPCHVREYISLSCPKCLTFLREDFSYFFHTYVQTGRVRWTFHPVASDLLTLEMMVCLDELTSDRDKQSFFLSTAAFLNEETYAEGTTRLEKLAGSFGIQLKAPLGDLEMLRETSAFEAAYAFLRQPNAVFTTPTLEIDGKLYNALPTRAFLEQTLKTTLKPKEGTHDHTGK